MEDSLSSKRRRFLRGAGVGGTALLAGCTDQFSTSPGTGGENAGGEQVDDDGGGADGEPGGRRAAVVTNPDRERLQEIQRELQKEVRSGELNRSKAQEEMMTRQREVMADAVSSLTESIESETSLRVDEEYARMGAVAASGSADAFLDSLHLDAVAALVPVAALNQQL